MVKFLVFLMFLFLILRQSTPTELSDSEGEVSDAQVVSDAALKDELNELKSKISLRESSLDERVQELKSKQKTIGELNKIIEEKSKLLAALQSQVLSLKEKLSSAAKKQEGEAHGRATEIQQQINSLKNEIAAQHNKKDALEARAKDAENRIQALNFKLENLHRTNDEQKSRILKTQRALEVAEEELMKYKMEAAYISKQLTEVQDAWLPPWFLVHLAYGKAFVLTHWNKHGKPCFDLAVKKALETKSELEKWAEPRIDTLKSVGLDMQAFVLTHWNKHGKPCFDMVAKKALETKSALEKWAELRIDTLKSEWIPIMKEHSSAFASDLGRHLQSLTSKAVDIYHVSKETVAPHVLKLQEVLDPHFQEAKKVAKPYVDQVSSQMKPHVDKAHVFLKPYTKKVVRTYRKFIKNMGVYREQVQATLHDLLKGHEFTKPLATKEFTFYMASAVVALPFIYALHVISSIFSKKSKRRSRSSHSSHTRRKHKRGHSDR